MAFYVVEVDNDGFKVYDSAGNLIDPAKDASVTALGTILTAIKNTDGIKKIVDALPAGTNNIGDVDVLSSALPVGASTEATLLLIKAKTDSIPSDPAKESGKLTSLETILTAIRDTAGIKKIVDPLPAGTNTIGKVDQGAAGASAWLVTGSGGGGSTQVEGRAADGSTPVGNPVLIGGQDGTNVQSVLTDSQGRIVIAPSGAVSLLAGFKVGYIILSAITTAAVRATTYTEQATDARRSVASANANDTAAGTGARTIKITYYNQTGAGPYTDTVTLNGTSYVNTVATDICFIEQMEVMTVGSGGANVGIITLKAAIGGGGATIGSIAASDNRTFWSHHYVPTGKTTYVTSLSIGHNGTTVGSGGLYTLKSIVIGTGNQPEKQISDFFRLYGQSSAVTRTFGTAIPVSGPAKITMYVTPESATTITFRGSFDFYEQAS